MATQPIQRATAADVERVAQRDFPAERVAEVLSILEKYLGDGSPPAPHRVRLAVLKLAAGNIDNLRREIERARYDYRDVLSQAEYPEHTKRMFEFRPLTPGEEQQIFDADWHQYQTWLAK
jgi:hypothetical protein